MRIKHLIYQNKLMVTILSVIVTAIATNFIDSNKAEAKAINSDDFQANNQNSLLATRICKYYRITKKSHFYHRGRRTKRYLRANVIVRLTRISNNGKYALVHYDHSNFTRSGHNRGWIKSSHLSCFKRN